MQIPEYLVNYLKDAGIDSTEQCIAVESNDRSALFLFNRFSHDTSVLSGDLARFTAEDGSFFSEI